MRLSDLLSIKGLTVKTSGGETVGKVAAIHVVRDKARPVFIEVRQGGKLKILPLANAKVKGDEITLPYTVEAVEAGPISASENRISTQQANQAFTHYGIHYQVAPRKAAQRALGKRRRKRARAAIHSTDIVQIVAMDWDDDILTPQPIEPSAASAAHRNDETANPGTIESPTDEQGGD
ncbi:PRC-barrel domain-containing protein [Streptomyces goshikiensis]|uniref:PRC-barrel domain-containing protein n=1 Tax=Streptomyces goshikiensis TaxID=1942 RepID=UPI0036A08825